MRHYRWPSSLLIAMVVLLCAAGPGAPVSAAYNSPAEYAPNEVLVKLKPATQVVAFAAAYGLDANPAAIHQLGQQPVYRLRILDGTPPPDKASALQNDPLVSFAEPNYLGMAPEARQQSSWAVGGDVGSYQKQWAPQKIRLAEAHTLTRGAGITVAVLDTGVDLGHPALAGHLAQGFDFVDLDANPSEEGVYGRDIAYGHGTHVAGLLALAAPEATIVPLRILKPDGTGGSWQLAQALRYAIDRRADVINLSYSTKYRSKLIDEVLAEITSGSGNIRGAVVVAAAGNSGTTSREYPAAEDLPGMLAVAATTSEDKLAGFSTRGSWVQVAAPGNRIISSVPNSQYGTWSGTSMAAPFTAGAVALVRAAYPSLKPAEVVSRVIATAATIKAPVPRRIDAAAAVGLPNAQNSK